MPRSHGCERTAMPPTVTVAIVTILAIIELFICLKAFAPKQDNFVVSCAA
ncbi:MULTISPECIES: hypothetical protein [unclassified Shewanella]|nr:MULTISPECIES: hypothetical protein [unclassified Shewanella]MBW3513605.1 hypothetical protein [Shewanella sp. NKUCC01_JLK]NRD30830.1 hypothetical protein [Shewanella sp. DC2-4]